METSGILDLTAGCFLNFFFPTLILYHFAVIDILVCSPVPGNRAIGARERLGAGLLFSLLAHFELSFYTF